MALGLRCEVPTISILATGSLGFDAAVGLLVSCSHFGVG